jgi:prepilin-type N-terminal cleavage/methylation domain-containing protein
MDLLISLFFSQPSVALVTLALVAVLSISLVQLRQRSSRACTVGATLPVLVSTSSVGRSTAGRSRSQGGFTLLELLIVVFILCCLVVVGGLIVYFVFFSGHIHVSVT